MSITKSSACHRAAWLTCGCIKVAGVLVNASLLVACCSTDLLAEIVEVNDVEQLRRALKSAEPGDRLQLRAGEWRDLQIAIECRGKIDQPIIIEAAQPGATLLTGHTRLRLGSEHVIVRNLDFRKAWHEDAIIEFRADSKKLARHCKLDACRFQDCNPADLQQDSKVVSLYGEDNRVTRCEIEGKRNRGATVVVWLKDKPVRHRLDHNYFGPRERLGKNGGETIRVGDSATSLVSAQCRVEENLFEECNGEAEIISNKSCDNVYAHNTFRRCAGALTLRHGHRCRVEGNFFLGESAKGTGGIRVIGENHVVANNLLVDLQGTDQRAAISIMNGLQNSPLNGYSPVKGVQVLFNTIVDCKQSLLIGLVDEDNVGTVPPTDCRFVGNIFHSRHEPLVMWLVPMGKIDWDFNCFSGSAVGDRFGRNRIEGDPMLERESSGMLRLSLTSPARGQFHISLPDVTHDIEGHIRVVPMDLGCDQILPNSASVYHPLTKTEVGRHAQVD